MVAYHGLEFPHYALAELCRRHGIRRLSVFGSILREAAGVSADDPLKEFLEKTPTLTEAAA